MVLIGAHVDQDDPAAHAAQVGAEVVQFFLGDPQGYDKPVLPAKPVEGVDIYIHAPYLVNVATTNNRIRIPSRKLLEQHLKAAASLGAKGLIVHGGHVNKSDDPQKGFDNWRKVFERMECPIPVLIENTAGGGNAMARKLERIARLWDALDGFDVGFCLDTCHAHAGGEELVDVVDRVKAITGRIDLVHCNDSRDDFDSGADRHANLGKGRIDPELILAVCRAAGAPIVVETPGEGQAEDIAFLRKNL
ncbi:deoxyribonuclease IV [Nonomuraea gerenzanensis]|uniref:Endonuclease IV n=1 Tax=Nonomuraea gerenzanensis TaxID=93944 RepID=A0A1M4DX42_9ACTN|nr:deoxyribonuclease IV [Nonomuraea gerenzanensis]UBU13432.1 deoxyribonuclease IV [Nonomuraea gerenzanensis]SBO91094.1 Endonuclease IV [Nonomuraea gerenzanensis]